MINKHEIMEHAQKYNLSANTIEKDYVLNWMLAGIGASKVLYDKWVFKGGTCLKKCYFEEYRFSEDLDFTIIEPSHIDKTFLITQFSIIADWHDMLSYQIAGLEHYEHYWEQLPAVFEWLYKSE